MRSQKAGGGGFSGLNLGGITDAAGKSLKFACWSVETVQGDAHKE